MRTLGFEPADGEQRLFYSYLPWRHRNIYDFCCATGCRIGDALAVRTESLGRRMELTESKTSKLRAVSLPLKLYRRLKYSAGAVWLFTSPYKHDRPYTRQAVWIAYKKAAKRAGVALEGIGTHTARKTYALELLVKTGSLEEVRKALSHSRIDVTIAYLFSRSGFVGTGFKL